MKEITEYKTINQFANAYARSMGYGIATSIIPGEELKIADRTDYGYRKFTTGEYVPNAYRANFGWKNTYYQPAETVIEVPKKVVEYFENN